MATSVLRKKYEAIRGANICDRQWRTIKGWLRITDENDFDRLPDIEAYAQLRALHPKAPINLGEVLVFRQFLEAFPLQGYGDDLFNAIQRVLEPTPSRQTIYRWGWEMQLPLYKNRFYTSDEVKRWLAKILTQRRFKLKYRIPQIRKAS